MYVVCSRVRRCIRTHSRIHIHLHTLYKGIHYSIWKWLMGVALPSVTYAWWCTHRRIDRRMREARDGRMNGWRERRRDRETDREVGGTLFVDQRTRSCDALCKWRRMQRQRRRRNMGRRGLEGSVTGVGGEVRKGWEGTRHQTLAGRPLRRPPCWSVV